MKTKLKSKKDHPNPPLVWTSGGIVTSNTREFLQHLHTEIHQIKKTLNDILRSLNSI